METHQHLTPEGSRPRPAPSFLKPEHWVDRHTVVSVVRRVGGNSGATGGTAFYRYGMDIVFTVHCRLCRTNVDARGVHDAAYLGRRVRCDPDDPHRWWRGVLESVRLHRESAMHRHAVTAQGLRGR